VSAAHVVETAREMDGDIYVSPIKDGLIDFSKFVEIPDEVGRSKNDVFVWELNSGLWSLLGVQQLATAYTQEGETVTARGFVKGQFSLAIGTVKPIEKLFNLAYSCSTLPSFSGGPIMFGRKVTALHLEGTPTFNRGANIAFVLSLMQLDKDSRNQLEGINRGRRGKKMYRAKLNEYMSFERETGHTYWKGTRVNLTMDDDFVYITNQSGKMLEYVYIDEVEDAYGRDIIGSIASHHPFSTYSRENAYIPLKKLIVDFDDGNPDVTCALEEPERFSSSIFTLVDRKKPLFVRDPAVPSAVVSEVLLAHEEHATKLGYERGKYVMPVINAETEKTAFLNRCDVFAKRRELVPSTPGSRTKRKDIERKAVDVCLQMLASNQFQPRYDFDSIERIKEVIQSSAINLNSSPGFPFVDSEYTTNEQVINAYGVDGLAEFVKQNWDTDYASRMFGKREVHKREKVDNDMLRMIAGSSLVYTIISHCVFSSLSEAMIDNYRDSPIIYGWSPYREGDHRWLVSEISGYESYLMMDKTQWEDGFLEEIATPTEELILRLAVKPTGMSPERFAYWKDCASTLFLKFLGPGLYRLNDGSVYQKTVKGKLNSGCYLTIVLNSLAQLYLHVAVCLRMELKVAEIEQHMFKAGGDDTVFAWNGSFEVQRYLETYNFWGVSISDYSQTDNVLNVEFFSTKSKLVDAVASPIPLRFNKHVSSLTYVRESVFADALISHMINYCFDDSRFQYFYDLYVDCCDRGMEGFFLADLPFKRTMRNRIHGLESVKCSDRWESVYEKLKRM